jgi:hypothetical protein
VAPGTVTIMLPSFPETGAVAILVLSDATVEEIDRRHAIPFY